MPRTSEKKVLLIGHGLIGRVHARNIMNAAGISLGAVLTKNPKVHEGFQVIYGVPFYKELSEIRNLEEFSGVVIATPNNYHLDYMLWALSHNLKVLVEKPVLNSMADLSSANFDRLIKNSDNILVGHHRLHGKILSEARRIIGDNFGEVVAVSVDVVLKKPTVYFEEADWRKKPGAGPIQINATHEVATLIHLFGRIRCVTAIGSNSSRGFEVEDTAGICLVFENGIVATLLVSDNCSSVSSWELLSGENPVYPHVFGHDCIRVHGSENSLFLPSLTKISGGADYDWHKTIMTSCSVPPSAQFLDPMFAEMQNFSSMLNFGEKPLVNISVGLHILEVTTAVHQSILSRKQVDVKHLSYSNLDDQ